MHGDDCSFDLLQTTNQKECANFATTIETYGRLLGHQHARRALTKPEPNMSRKTRVCAHHAPSAAWTRWCAVVAATDAFGAASAVKSSAVMGGEGRVTADTKASTPDSQTHKRGAKRTNVGARQGGDNGNRGRSAAAFSPRAAHSEISDESTRAKTT